MLISHRLLTLSLADQFLTGSTYHQSSWSQGVGVYKEE